MKLQIFYAYPKPKKKQKLWLKILEKNILKKQSTYYTTFVLRRYYTT